MGKLGGAGFTAPETTAKLSHMGASAELLPHVLWVALALSSV